MCHEGACVVTKGGTGFTHSREMEIIFCLDCGKLYLTKRFKFVDIKARNYPYNLSSLNLNYINGEVSR